MIFVYILESKSNVASYEAAADYFSIVPETGKLVVLEKAVGE